MMDKTTHLLSLTSKIAEKYHAIDRATGQQFNVFSILGLESAEVKTHSAFLAELLNPKGSHYQGDLFLKLFLNHLEIENFNTSNASVEVEKHIGTIDDKYESGGQIDLYISDNNSPPNIIIIENKIWAGDQYNQLKRYQNYATSKTSENRISLYYLTPSGSSPSSESKVDLIENKDFKLLSYSSDILQWLEECLKAITLKEYLRVNISQYINIIRKMTNQAENSEMTKELAILYKNKDFFDGFFELEKAMKYYKFEAQKNFWESLIEHLEDSKIIFQYGYSNSKDNKEYLIDRVKKYTDGGNNLYFFGLHILLGELNDSIRIFFKIGMYYRLYFGIQCINNDNKIIKQNEFPDQLNEIKEKLEGQLTKSVKKWKPEQNYILSTLPRNNFNFSDFKSDVYFNFCTKPQETIKDFLSELDQDIEAVRKVINEEMIT